MAISGRNSFVFKNSTENEASRIASKSEPEYVYLRLERWGISLDHSISPDGKTWLSVGGTNEIGMPAKLKVCLAAYTTSSDPSKVIFDQLTISQDKKRERWEFVSGWGDPVDPDKDCKIKRDKDALTIEMPGSDHDYDPVRKRLNAPRLLSELEGDFDLVVRVRIDYRPSAQSTVKGQPSYVSAGFLLINPAKTDLYICARLDYAVSQQGNRPNAYTDPPVLDEPRRKDAAPKMDVDSYAVKKTWICRQGKTNGIEGDGGLLWDRGWQNWPLPEKADYAYLRLERRDVWSCFFISPDGKSWTPLFHQQSMPAKGKIGLAAYSTSTEPSKVTFDQLKLARGKKK